MVDFVIVSMVFNVLESFACLTICINIKERRNYDVPLWQVALCVFLSAVFPPSVAKKKKKVAHT